MIQTFEDLTRTLDLLFPAAVLPKPFHLATAVRLVREQGLAPKEAARSVRTTAARVTQLAAAADPVVGILGQAVPSLTAAIETRARAAVGQLLIGNLAERVFEDLYRRSVQSPVLELRDDRTARGDTDYLVFDEQGRQVFRINIKFHGSAFKKAKEMVGLEPENCFALATYKIRAALQKQETEQLPYIFVIVGVPGLTGEIVGRHVPEDLIHLCGITRALGTGIRTFEDQIVKRLAGAPVEFGFEAVVQEYSEKIRQAKWFVLSARRADKLLHEHLFDRVYALRVRAFARNYGNAEVDMHFSLSEDLRPLAEFLQVLRDGGLHGLTARLERGTL